MSGTPGDELVSVRVHYIDPLAAQAIRRSTGPRVSAMLGEDVSEGGVRLLSPEMPRVETPRLRGIEPENWAEPIRAAGNAAKARWVAQTGSPKWWKSDVNFTELRDDTGQRLGDLVAFRQGS